MCRINKLLDSIMNHPGQYCDSELNATLLLKLGSRSNASELTKKGLELSKAKCITKITEQILALVMQTTFPPNEAIIMN